MHITGIVLDILSLTGANSTTLEKTRSFYGGVHGAHMQKISRSATKIRGLEQRCCIGFVEVPTSGLV